LREREKKHNLKRDAKLDEYKQDMDKKPRDARPDYYLSMSDFYRKSSELMMWLHETRGKRLEGMPTEDALDYFYKFAKMWNCNGLDQKYFKGVSSAELDPDMRTSYRWKFTEKVDTMELASARDAVGTDTNNRVWAELPREYRKHKDGEQESDRDRERRERFEAREREFADADPFEQRKKWQQQSTDNFNIRQQHLDHHEISPDRHHATTERNIIPSHHENSRGGAPPFGRQQQQRSYHPSSSSSFNDREIHGGPSAVAASSFQSRQQPFSSSRRGNKGKKTDDSSNPFLAPLQAVFPPGMYNSLR
jgi:hypothetical protein